MLSIVRNKIKAENKKFKANNSKIWEMEDIR